MTSKVYVPHIVFCRFVLNVLFLLAFSKNGWMYPNGAPNSACVRMDPSITRTHDGGRQDDSAPFKLVPSKKIVENGGAVILTIDNLRSTSSPTFFKGFIVQAVKMNSEETFGKFIINESDKDVRPMTCSGVEGSSATHKHNAVKSSVNLTWEAPEIQEKTGVEFYFTVMTDKKKYWVRQKAETSLFVESKALTESDESTTEPESEPEAESEPKPETIDNPVDEAVKETGCSSGSKGCFGFPSNCVETKNCDMLVTYSFDEANKKYNFELSKRKMSNGQYIALGFSNDSSMGEDLIFSCSNSPSKEFQVKAGWNTDKSQPTLIDHQINVKVDSVSNNNGNFACKFSLDEEMIFKTPDSSEVKVNLGNKWHLLLASGPTVGDDLGFHDSKIPSAEKVDLQSTVEVAAGLDSKLFIQVHGTLMAIAWLCLAATGMVIARYYKQTWKNVKPCNKDLWFRVHQVVMTLVVLSSIVAFILMWIVKGFLLYSIEDIRKNPHPATGFATILCACIQPVMAYFRPHPDTSKRWVFNWLHWFVGNSAYVLAICSIFLAVELPSAELKGKLVDVMLIIYIAVHVIVHLILTFQHCKSIKQNDVNGNEEYSNDPNKDMKGSAFRKILALVYVVFISIIAIALVIMIFKETKEILGNEDITSSGAIGSSEPEASAEGQALSESEPEAESENAIPEAAAEGK